MTRTAPVWLYAEVNPATPEFKTLDDGTEVSFMPLEAVWPGGKGDYTNTLPWSSEQSYSQFRRGDILVPKITPTFEAGRTIIAEIPFALGLASTEVHVVRPNAFSDPRFLQYCFQSLPFLDEGAHSLQGVGNLRRITPRFVQEHKVLDATLDTQRAIADYLDRETGEIDAMIAKMDELAETLEMRRSKAVAEYVECQCEGAPMLPLGVASPFTTGATPPTKNGKYFGEGFAWANISDLGPKTIDKTAKSITPEGFAAASFGPMAQSGDLLFSFKLSVGTVSIAAAPMLTNEAIATFRPNGSLDMRFAYYMLPLYLRKAANVNIYGAPLLNGGIMNRARVPVPPREEQRRIADHLDEVTGKIDAMLAKVAELKSLLIERRAALITDVVTGRKAVA